MAELEATPAGGVARSREEIALELMKFVALTTGYGKGAPAAGYTGKIAHTPEEYADALLELYQRCRRLLETKE
jgi:hypothetical protein